MISRGRALIGALALCALSICAFAAVSASASELTAVTCKEVEPGTGEYGSSHCATPKVPGSNFETVALPLNTTTELEGGSTELEPTLRVTVAGVGITIKCASNETLEPKIANREPTVGKHTIEFTSARTTYLGCAVLLKSNEARVCEVETITGPVPGETGKIATTKLKGTTTGEGHKFKLEPAEGEVFTEFGIHPKPAGHECFFNSTVKVTVSGSVEGEVNASNHSHATFTEETNGNGLKVGGSIARYIATTGGTMKGTENTVGAETFT